MQDIQESQMAELVIKLNLLTIKDTQIIEQGKQLYINFVQTFSGTNCLSYIDWNYLNLKVCVYSLAAILIATKPKYSTNLHT